MPITIDEINEQPLAIRTVLDELGGKESKLAEVCSDATSFCFVGCGASYYLSLTGASLMNERSPSFAVPSSEILISPSQLPDLSPDVLIPISRSGESTETVEATRLTKRKSLETTVVSVTCAEGSEIHELSDIPIISRKGKEESVVMTKSFSSMLVALQYLSLLAANENRVSKKFRGLGKDSEQVLEVSEDIARKIGSREELDKFIFLGTGKHYGLASEGMLLMTEMALSWSNVYHPLELRHGPKSIVAEDTLVTILWPDGGGTEHERLFEEVRNLGAETLVIGREEDVKEIDADEVVEITQRSNSTGLSLYVPPLQLLGYYRAIDQGLDPDNPKNLNQIVKI